MANFFIRRFITSSHIAWMERSADFSKGVFCRLTMTKDLPSSAVLAGILAAGVTRKLLPRTRWTSANSE